jgi:tRNA (guanine-N7-)-methyltransferase
MQVNPDTEKAPLLRFYGRRKGRPLNNARQAALAQLDDYTFTLPESGEFNPAALGTPFTTACHLEIGFGNGEHLAELAAAQPHIGFIGAEPFINGIACCLQHIQQRGLSNVRIWPSDVRPLLDALAPASLDCIYIMFNDPWPKARHAERRFVSPANLARLARVLKTGGTLKLATDDPGLQTHTEEHMAAQTFFTPAPGLHKTRPDWPHTRYESKAVLAGRTCRYYEYRKV